MWVIESEHLEGRRMTGEGSDPLRDLRQPNSGSTKNVAVLANGESNLQKRGGSGEPKVPGVQRVLAMVGRGGEGVERAIGKRDFSKRRNFSDGSKHRAQERRPIS
jgi:hypothetical protein